MVLEEIGIDFPFFFRLDGKGCFQKMANSISSAFSFLLSFFRPEKRSLFFLSVYGIRRRAKKLISSLNSRVERIEQFFRKIEGIYLERKNERRVGRKVNFARLLEKLVGRSVVNKSGAIEDF